MAGRRKLSQEEEGKILESLEIRDRCIFSIGIKTGFRISEILSLNIIDVYDGTNIKPSIHVTKANMKGKNQSRTIPLHNDTKLLLKEWVTHTTKDRRYEKTDPLFSTRQNSRLSRSQFHRILKDAAMAATNGNESRVASHSMRKTFAWKIYLASGKDYLLTSKALGHKSPSSTVNYLEIGMEEISNIILA